MITLDEALQRVVQQVRPLGTERVALEAAYGRVLAEAVTARDDAPRRAVSMRDGYAVLEAALRPGEALAVIGEAWAGRPFEGEVAAGQAVRIFTGATVPSGADCVVMQEYAVAADGKVAFEAGYGPERHVRAAGSDFRAGDTLVAGGVRLGAGALVAAAAADRATVLVARRPRVAILATGDELAAPGDRDGPTDGIPETASYGVASVALESGGLPVSRRIAGDDLDALGALAEALLAEADVVVVIGGASVGARDFAKPMFAAQGLELVFDCVAMKPGKPVWLGRARGRWVLGLPGNPGSALVTASLFLRPLLARLQGAEALPLWRRLPLAAPLAATGARETFERATWLAEGLVPVANQDSGAQAALAEAEWLIRRPPQSAALGPDAVVAALPL